MYRSIANFGIWCTSPQTPLTPTSTTSTKASSTARTVRARKITITGTIPDFVNNLIRQRISTHGIIREMEPESQILCLNLPPEQICIIHSGPTKRWLTKKQKWDAKYAKQKRQVQVAREKECLEAHERGFLGGDLRGEMPPPSALAGRPSVRIAMKPAQETKRRKNLAGWVWGLMGGKDDKVKEDYKAAGEEIGEEQREQGCAYCGDDMM